MINVRETPMMRNRQTNGRGHSKATTQKETAKEWKKRKAHRKGSVEYTNTYIYIYMERERERVRQIAKQHVEK
jgi:hypothetical protein